MRIIDYLDTFSIDLEHDDYDDYDLILKREDCHNDSGMVELLRINYQSYIYTVGKEELAERLGQYANAQIEQMIVGKYYCVIFIKDDLLADQK